MVAQTQKTQTMFTKEFIIEAANQYQRDEQACSIQLNMIRLGINNAIVEAQCQLIRKEKEDFVKKALDYMFSFMPEELVKQLEIVKLSGAFATNITGKASFNAELHIHLKDKILNLKFDNEKKCLYHQSWMEGEYAELLDKYMENNSKFDSWIKE